MVLSDRDILIFKNSREIAKNFIIGSSITLVLSFVCIIFSKGPWALFISEFILVGSAVAIFVSSVVFTGYNRVLK